MILKLENKLSLKIISLEHMMQNWIVIWNLPINIYILIDEKNMRNLLKCINLRYYSSKMKKKKKNVNGLSGDVTTYHLRIWSDPVRTSVHTNCDGPYIWIWPR